MRSISDANESVQENNIAQNKAAGNNGSNGVGEVIVVGLGPGSYDDMTPRALKAIQAADLVVGYNTYIKLIEGILKDKKVLGTAMMQEIDRCRAAVDEAAKGQKVAVVSSGDAGVYGMAGLVLELAMQYDEASRPRVEVVPGISAVNASAAILGAPLMHDFAVISLSDLLTPWELIQKRIELAAQGDFVTAFYNPKSKKRVTQIEEVREITLKYKSPETPVGIVRNASRDNQDMTISTLADFTKEEINMFSLVIIGNSRTKVENGKMITPRGYKL